MVTDVPVGRTFAAPRLDAAPQPGWRRRGPPRAKYQAEEGKKSPEPFEVPRQMLEQLERGHVRSKPGEESHGHVYEFIRTDSDVVGKTTTSGYKPQSVTSLFCPQDVRRRCMIGTAATVVSLPLAILLCCVVIQRRKSKQRLSAASGAQPESGVWPSRPDSRTSRPGTPASRTQRQQPPLLPEKPERPLSPRPPRPPSPSLEALQRRNQTSALQPQPQPKQPPCPLTPATEALLRRSPPGALQPQPQAKRPPRPPSPTTEALQRRSQPGALQP
ncbi:uncharacterized protein [Ciconia boyciana]|uniref:uncharacterized protein n=1 Tax=Ciconia boyciana TaxID=52775 RepID=UPI003BA1287F